MLVSATKGMDCFKGFGNTKTAKQTIRKCLTDWTNFFKALRAWKKHRGLYVSSAKQNVSKDGFALNADVNGSLNIRRKVFPEFQFAGIGDRSLAARPVALNPLKPSAGCWRKPSERQGMVEALTLESAGVRF
jgi:hypothetical protein